MTTSASNRSIRSGWRSHKRRASAAVRASSMRAFPLENRVGHFANVVVVVHQQDGLGSSPACGLALRPARESGRALRIYCRQVDPEGRAAGGRALHRDGPSALAVDPVYGGEIEMSSLAD